MIVQRLLWSVPLMFIVSVLTFVLVALTPGDPAEAILGPNAAPAEYDALNEQLGFNRPLFSQYLDWLWGALHGDLGVSIVSRTPVADQLMARLAVTLPLAIGAILLAAVIGITIGTIGATRGGVVGRLTDVTAMVGYAVPNFLVGIVLVSVFALTLGWLPATGFVRWSDDPAAAATSLILPVLALSLSGITGVAKQTRDAMKDTMSQPYVDALRADGHPRRTIVLRHGLRNAAIPIVTMCGIIFIGMLGGTVFVETVFALPGLGSLANTAAAQHDIPTIQAISVYFTLIVITVNLAVDILYTILNPKATVA